MRKTVNKLILILIILAVAFTVVACTNNGGGQGGGGGGGSGGGDTPVVIDKTAVFEKITNGLSLAGDKISGESVRHVESEYTVVVNRINITIKYEADYNLTRKQDSEIMLKIFDNQYEMNRIFVYYYKGTLYMEVGGEKTRIENFGGTSSFELFFTFITPFDMESYLFSESFSETFNSLNLFADAANMSSIKVADNVENITIKNVNLDRIKNNVNGFIKKFFGDDTFGTKLDALTEYFLGIKLSDIGDVEIGLFNASFIEIILTDNAVSDFRVIFSGTQSDNVNTYLFDINYVTRPESSKINLDRRDDVDTNVYPETQQGNLKFTGTLYIPSLNETFPADISARLNSTDNAENKFNIKIGEVANFYYSDSTLFVDIEGLMRRYTGTGIDLAALNFPKVKLESLDIAQYLAELSSIAMNFIRNEINFDELFGDINFEDFGDITNNDIVLIDPNSTLGILLKNIESENGVFKLTINSELVSAISDAYDTSITDFLTSLLGISEETLEAIMGIGVLDNLTAELTFDTNTEVIGIAIFSSDELMAELKLTAEEVPGTGVEINPPEGFQAEQYKDLLIPETVTLHLEGELRMQGREIVDFSGLMGAFIGDVTGKNTPLNFKINDRLFLAGDFWTEDGKTYSLVKIWLNPVYNSALKVAANISSAPLITIAVSPEDNDVFLVYNGFFDVRYKMNRDGLLEAFNDLLGDDNIFSTDNIIEVFKIITRDANVLVNEDHLAFSLSPYTQNGISYDPIKEILGVDSMIADLRAQIKFTAPVSAENPSDYTTPVFERLPDIAFESMYGAKWHEDCDVTFGSTTINFKLSFLGESAELVTGKYYYEPTAKLLGERVEYVMVLTDTVNGTKRIRDLAVSTVAVDPSLPNAIPEYISVVYEDGTLGTQKFEIVGFPYTNNNINYALSGAAPVNYEIIIGNGSIREERYILPIEILNRNVVASEYYGNIPIVRNVYIDPYEYSINKLADPNYNPIGSVLDITFGSNRDNSSVVIERLENFDWNFDQKLIDYSGGKYYVIGHYNLIPIAMRVEIRAKTVDYIQITGELPGEYTVDSLISSSYTMPIVSTSEREIRIYFKTGKYRIIGDAPDGYVNNDPNCDGYYPTLLRWTYTRADNVTLDRTVNPLNGGRTDINYCQFGDDIGGRQTVKLNVKSPSRRASTMTDTVYGIIELYVNETTGEIDEIMTVRNPIQMSSVGLGLVDGALDYNGAMFPLDPYAKEDGKILPSYITMTVEHAGESIRKAYRVDWEESTIIDTDGRIKVPVAAENYFRVTGIIGDDETNKQRITVVIHNLSGEFDSLDMVDANTGTLIELVDGKYSISVNPYDSYALPTEFTLNFDEGAAVTHATNWMVNIGGEEISIADGFKFPYTGGEFELNTYVSADSAMGILAQKVTLYVNVNPKTAVSDVIFGLSPQMTPNDRPAYISINPYSEESSALLETLLNKDSFGIAFLDGSVVESGLPIMWDNLNDVISALKNEGGTSLFANGYVVLKGMVYKNSQALEQEVSVKIQVDSKIIRGAGFNNLDELAVAGNIVGVNINVNDKNIVINLYKPFVLATRDTDRATPYAYLRYLFESVRLSFADDTSGDYSISGGIPENLDELAFTFVGNQQVSEVRFVLPSLSEGSREENFTIILYTQRDDLTTNSLTENIETFVNDGGTPLYPEGFRIPSSLEVTYTHSGNVTYDNLIWYSEGNYAPAGSSDYLLTAGDIVEGQTIPSLLFRSMTGATVWLYTTLPNGDMVRKAFVFYSKNIGNYLYNADAENSLYNIRDGRIYIRNIYEYYPFDPSKLPNLIIPVTGVANPSYQISDTVYFAVTWKPTADFANSSGGFDRDRINAFFNGEGFASDYDTDMYQAFATADIQMYNGEFQTISLYIDVERLENYSISHEALEINDNKAIIDPYFNNFGGNYVLPKDITVSYSNGISHKFGGEEAGYNLSYAVLNRNTGSYDAVESVPYTHLGHAIGNAYGAPTDDLQFRITLPDGLFIYYRVEFLSRELESVFYNNKTTKAGADGLLAGTYYIDPYDELTFNVPTEAKFKFKAGADITINVTSWTISSGESSHFTSDYIYNNRNGYRGETFTFNSSLSGYGVLPQEFSLQIVVLNRQLKDPYNTNYNFENPIAGLVKDIPNVLNEGMFVGLTESIYTAYNAIAEPVIPEIVWNLKDNEITFNGITNRNVTGVLTNGKATGESASVVINAPQLTFIDINGIVDSIIDFNPYTKESLLETFEISFLQNNISGVTYVFHPKEHAGNLSDAGNENGRMVIDWGEHIIEEQNLKVLRLGNYFKDLWITVEGIYRYNYKQIGITEINFGYGDGFAGSNFVELVIDPLNPFVPEVVQARGTDDGTPVEHANVKVKWDQKVYDFPLDADETPRPVQATVTAYSDDGITPLSEEVPFTVNVYYLNRVPVGIYTKDIGFSDGVIGADGLYPLLVRNTSNNSVNSYFRINPIDLETYDPATHTYKMPTNLTVRYKEDYGNLTIRNALDRLGRNMEFTELDWYLSGPITLDGTEILNDDGSIRETNPLTSRITACRMSYTVASAGEDYIVTSDRYEFPDGIAPSYDIGLQVTNRQVEYTSVSTRVVNADGIAFQNALSDYYIDPYEEGYLSSFPETIEIKYTGDTLVKEITNIEWSFDEDYLKSPDVITGKVGSEFMYVMASITVYGTKLEIRFRIKGRDIPTESNTVDGTTNPLQGGTIYVLKDKPLLPQLPKFLYYKFEQDGMLDIAPVPLSYPNSSILSVDVTKPGFTKKILAYFGKVDRGNIEFTIEVIDPQIYDIRTRENEGLISYHKGSFIYDKIVVARNSNNYYIIGREATLLPETVVINDAGNYLIVDSVDYTISFTNGIETSYATINCSYAFLSASDSPLLSGNAEGTGAESQMQKISFTVPVTSYDYTIIDSNLYFNTNLYSVPLGTTIAAGSLPVATDNIGNEYELFWDFSDVDTRTAGLYTAYGYYMTTSGRIITVNMAVSVDKYTLSDGDITISAEWLNRIYTGETLPLDEYLTIVPFLRSDGNYGQVEGFTVEYSIDNGVSWQTVQPLQVGEGYRIRITVQDYNVSGGKTFEFTIRKAVIGENAITFHQEDNSAATNSVSYEYNGEEQSPVIKGIPNDPNLIYEIRYELQNPDGSFSIQAPINSGTYRVSVSFPEQRNYRAETETVTVLMFITRKNVTYSIVTQMTYNGELRNVEINGLPENPARDGINVVYTYYDAYGNLLEAGSRIRNAGNYFVSVTINGGRNYPSANIDSVNQNLTYRMVTINPKKVVLNVNTVISEYLQEIKPLNSAVTFTDADDPTKPGLQGADTAAIFGNISVFCRDVPNGILTYRHMVGTYNLSPNIISADSMPTNYTIDPATGYVAGTYIIAKADDAVVIENRAHLNDAINSLRDMQEVKWYLRGDNYGDIVIDKNATVSIVGSYDLISGEIAVKFDSVTIKRGAVTIDIAEFQARGRTASVSIGRDASYVTVNRAAFIRQGTSFLTGSIAINADSNYSGVLTVQNTTVYGYTSAIYMQSGSLSVSDSVFDSNIQGIQVQNGDLYIINSDFLYTKGTAVYFTALEKEISVNESNFTGNIIAIRSYAELAGDITIRNEFINNAQDVEQIY